MPLNLRPVPEPADRTDPIQWDRKAAEEHLRDIEELFELRGKVPDTTLALDIAAYRRALSVEDDPLAIPGFLRRDQQADPAFAREQGLTNLREIAATLEKMKT